MLLLLLLLLLQGATKAAELPASEATASAARVVDDATALIVACVESANRVPSETAGLDWDRTAMLTYPSAFSWAAPCNPLFFF